MQDLLLSVERENGEGEGIAFADGKAVFLPGAMMGDRVRARIVQEARRYRRAEIVELIEPSPERIAPPCPYFGVCGGCAMQHMPYERALGQKERRVGDCLARIGGIAREAYEMMPALGMEEPWRYRNKATVPIEDGAIGFYREGSHTVVPVGDCLLQKDVFSKALNATREWLREGGDARSLLVRVGSGGDVLAMLTTDATLRKAEGWAAQMRSALPSLRGALFCRDADSAPAALFGDSEIRDESCGVATMVSARSFRQVNPAQAERLYTAALSIAALNGGETVIDAYCGAGIMTRLFAARCRSAVGIEIVSEAVGEARRAAEGVGNLHFLDGACEKHLPGMHCDVLVLDPPRKGCSTAVLRSALAANPSRIVYVSCDPATLARDVKALAEGGYRLTCAQPVDMFPWTAHVETVALLSRVEGSKT